ncbi:hypothetical protein NKG05_13725 [Oerskovia sp. M15]
MGISRENRRCTHDLRGRRVRAALSGLGARSSPRPRTWFGVEEVTCIRAYGSRSARSSCSTCSLATSSAAGAHTKRLAVAVPSATTATTTDLYVDATAEGSPCCSTPGAVPTRPFGRTAAGRRMRAGVTAGSAGARPLAHVERPVLCRVFKAPRRGRGRLPRGRTHPDEWVEA